MRRYAFDLRSIELTEDAVAAHDAVLIVTNHRAIDYGLLGRAARLIVDTRNAMEGIETSGRVVKA
jgi:UDP-N-acetyl-D-glucosamine dehydrogenase